MKTQRTGFSANVPVAAAAPSAASPAPAASSSEPPTSNAVVVAGAYASRRLASTGPSRAVTTRLSERYDIPQREALQSIYDARLAVLRHCNGGTRNQDVDACLDHVVTKILLPDWDPKTFRETALEAARTSQNSSVITHLDLTAELLVLRCGLRAHDTGAVLPKFIEKQLYRAFVKNVALVWGTEARQNAIADARRGGSESFRNVASVLRSVDNVRRALAEYDLDKTIACASNEDVTRLLHSEVEAVREALVYATEEAVGVLRPSELKELILLARQTHEALEGVHTLLEGMARYADGPEAPKQAEAEIQDILNSVAKGMPSSTQRFGIDKIRSANAALGSRLAVLAECLAADRPAFALDPFTRASVADVVAKSTKWKAAVPEGYEAWPAFDITLDRGDFEATGSGADLSGRYTLYVKADDHVVLVAHDRESAVWTALWPHHLPQPQKAN